MSLASQHSARPDETGAPESLAAAGQAALEHWGTWAWELGRVGVAVVVALLVHAVLFRVLRRAAKRTPFGIDDALVGGLRAPAMLALPLLAVQLVLPTVAREAPELTEFLRHANGIGLIAAVTWLMVGLVSAAERAILARHDVNVSDNLEARRVHTQLRVIRRTLVFIIVLIGSAAILMTFPRVRQLGTSILASAGIAGLIVGLAARPALENIIAGLQIALTQPIRLDDVVVISGEWGRIEEISSTYVVVKIWDERRLIVPFSRLLAEPFQNWTRTNADVLGTVFIHADYTVNVDELRAELERIVKGHPKWDGRTVGLVVTDAKERSMEIRALISAANSGDAWDLRCEVRERLIAYLQRRHPESLPRTRVELPRAHAGAAGAEA